MTTMLNVKRLFSYDASLATFQTESGTMTLPKVFLPFFLEMLLLNMMGTINTLMLSHYSDDAVAAVGAASQLVGMVLTLYTVIGTGASIVINHNLGRQKGSRIRRCFLFHRLLRLFKSDSWHHTVSLCFPRFRAYAPGSPCPPIRSYLFSYCHAVFFLSGLDFQYVRNLPKLWTAQDCSVCQPFRQRSYGIFRLSGHFSALFLSSYRRLWDCLFLCHQRGLWHASDAVFAVENPYRS